MSSRTGRSTLKHKMDEASVMKQPLNYCYPGNWIVAHAIMKKVSLVVLSEQCGITLGEMMLIIQTRKKMTAKFRDSIKKELGLVLNIKHPYTEKGRALLTEMEVTYGLGYADSKFS